MEPHAAPKASLLYWAMCWPELREIYVKALGSTESHAPTEISLLFWAMRRPEK